MVGIGTIFVQPSVGWFDGLAAILDLVEESGVRPTHLLDPNIVMIHPEGVYATPTDKDP